MKIVAAILSILKEEMHSIRNVCGWVLTYVSFLTVENVKSYLSVLVLLLTVIWWAIRIYKQLRTKGNDSN
jgi:hypothetical protein